MTALAIIVGLAVAILLTLIFLMISIKSQLFGVLARQSSRNFNSLFENNPAAVCAVDGKGDILSVNTAFTALSGYSKDELIGRPYRQLIGPDEQDKSWHAFGTVKHSESQNHEITVLKKEGTGVPTAVTCFPRFVNNRIDGKFSIINDITSKKLSEQAVQESETRYCLLAETSPEAIMVCRTVEVLYANSAAAKLMRNFKPDQLIGKSLLSMIHPDDLHAALQELNLVAKKCQKVAHLECKIILSDNSLISAELMATPILFQGEQAVQIILNNRAATKQMETELLKSNSYLLQAKNIGELGTWEWDLSTDKILLDDESCRILDFLHKKEISFQDYLSYIHPDDLDHVVEISKAEKEGESFHVEYRIIKPDGAVRVIEAQSDPNFDETRNITSVFGIVKDITEEKKTEELLWKTVQLSALIELSAGVAHEIRNPLNSISGIVQLLQMSTDAKQKREQEYLQIIRSELDRLNEMLGEFLTTARPQNDTSKQPTDIKLMIGTLVTLFNSHALTNKIRIRTFFESDLPLILCNQNQIKQVLINIIKNALEAMPDGGNLRIEVERHDRDNVVLRVTDDGVGIVEEDMEKLLTPFFTTKKTGTGLGLSISSKIIKEHGGSVTVSSILDIGTKVEVSLPTFSEFTLADA